MRDLLHKQRSDPKHEEKDLLKNNSEKDSLKKDSQYIILKALNQIIKPSLMSADIEV